MELHLVVPAVPGDKHVEMINGREWCVKGPIDIHHVDRTKFHCVSYVWGFGREKVGGLFDSQIEISDQTRPALEAAIRAIKVAQEGKGKMIEAFWIDAICVPQKDGRAREATLESMGFIYSAAESVIVVLQAPTWAIIKSATAGSVHDFIKYDELKVLERDEWIKSPWTYQEIVNSNSILFTALVVPGALADDIAIDGSPFLNYVGLSLDRWKKRFKKAEMEVLAEFRNLSALADTLADAEMSGYLDRTALCVLSNIGQRRYNPQFPKNSLLAALGALTKDVSWGDPAESVSELAEKVMETCEMNNDFSFIYTADQRDQKPGNEWRPDPQQADFGILRPMHLVPIIKWYSWGEKQGGRKDGQGFWLENMVPLKQSAVTNNAGNEYILRWIQGSEAFCEDGGVPAPGFSKWQQGQGVNLEEAVLYSLKAIGFTGSDSYQRCENGLFFSQELLEGRREVEMFAASSIRWNFGSPGIARWKEDNGDMRYCAGVFAGDILNVTTQQLLLC